MIVSLMAVAALQQAPNPGYASSVISTSALLVALAAPLLFPRVSLTSSAFAGLLLVAAGVTMVSLSARAPVTNTRRATIGTARRATRLH